MARTAEQQAAIDQARADAEAALLPEVHTFDAPEPNEGLELLGAAYWAMTVLTQLVSQDNAKWRRARERMQEVGWTGFVGETGGDEWPASWRGYDLYNDIYQWIPPAPTRDLEQLLTASKVKNVNQIRGIVTAIDDGLASLETVGVL